MLTSSGCLLSRLTRVFRIRRAVCVVYPCLYDDFTNPFIVLVQGPYLVRGASISKSKLAVTGDIVNATTIEVFAPKAVESITWNGKAVKTKRTAYGSLKGSISAPKSVTLPALTSWKAEDSLPERLTTYDDSGAAWVGKYNSC